MEAKLYGQKAGGMNINGIIEDYYVYAGEDISAGDLVEYINGVASRTDYGTSEDTLLNANANKVSHLSAVTLPNGNVFIAYGHSSTLYGVVCMINGASISVGTETALSTLYVLPDGNNYDVNTRTAHCISALSLENGNVFVCYSGTSGYMLCARVCMINGTTITVGEEKQLGGYGGAGIRICSLLLSTGYIAVAHSYLDSQGGLALTICSIDGTTISYTNLSSYYGSGHVHAATELSNGNLMLVYGNSSMKSVYAKVVKLEGTKIVSSGTEVQLNSGDYSANELAIVSLPNNNVIVFHTTKSKYALFGCLCTINGTTITKVSTKTINNSENYTSRPCYARKLKNDKVLVVYGQNHTYGSVCSVEGTTFTVGTALMIQNNTTYAVSATELNNGTVFVPHSSPNYYLRGSVLNVVGHTLSYDIVFTEYENQVRKVTTPTFNGVAKTNGTGGDETAHKDKVKVVRKLTLPTDKAISFVWLADGTEKTIRLATSEATTINWGDGTTTTTTVETNTAFTEYKHTYKETDKYYTVYIEDNVVTTFMATSGKIELINVDNATSLKQLSVQYNNLSSLDTSKNTALIALRCSANALTEIDVSNNTQLDVLEFHNNNISHLDISRNTLLTSLHAYKNKLTSLDTSKNTALKILYAYNNKLTALNVVNNTALMYFDCYGNMITELDVSNNTSLVRLKANPMPTAEETTLQTITMATGQTIATLEKPDSTTIIYK